MVSTKRLEDKVFERIYNKYLKKETKSPKGDTPLSSEGEGNGKPSASSGGLKGETPLSPLPVYKIPFIPIKPKETTSPSTSRDRTYGSINSLQKKPQMASSGEGERKPSVSSGDLIGIGLIVFMIALPFLLLADWGEIINRLKEKINDRGKGDGSSFNPFQVRW